MTREEAITHGKEQLEVFGGEHREFIEMAIKALEQEPKTDVLDKIRTEICISRTEHEMQLAENDIKGKLIVSDIYCDIVNIIDKYKAESEDKE